MFRKSVFSSSYVELLKFACFEKDNGTLNASAAREECPGPLAAVVLHLPISRNAVSVKVFNLRILAKNGIVRRPAGGYDYLSGN